jgi:phage-related protein
MPGVFGFANPIGRMYLMWYTRDVGQNQIARVLFYIDKKSRMVLLHGFIKKTQKTPHDDLDLAKSNKGKHQRGLQ